MKKKTFKTPAKRNRKSENLPPLANDCVETAGSTPYLQCPTLEPTIYDRRKSLLTRISSQIAKVECLQNCLLREQVALTHSRNELTNITRELQAELALSEASA